MSGGGGVVWLGEVGADDRAAVGGKTAGLSPHARRFLVPPGFCLPVGAEPATAEAIAAAYTELGARAGQPDPPVAVRSSAVDEDGSGASFAGVYETFLNVTGAAAVAEAVDRCRASAADARVAEYRRARNIPGGAAVAVLVQELVVADVSAVVFTADPVSGDRGRVVINATWGLGEALVSGVVTPDSFTVAKEPVPTIVERHPAAKERMTVPVEGGVSTVGVPRGLVSVPCLDDDAILAAARLGLDLEAVLGHACDVECAWSADRLYLLQCRPVTTLGRRSSDTG